MEIRVRVQVRVHSERGASVAMPASDASKDLPKKKKDKDCNILWLQDRRTFFREKMQVCHYKW